MKTNILLLSLLSCFLFTTALKNGLGITPAMGWNSWYAFFCDVTEEKMKQAVDAMVAYGLRNYGYEYVNIDDCWSMGRDENGVLLADNVTFPSGIAALAEYVHSRGFKLGIYGDSGLKTCGSRPGSYGYEEIDAKTFASWGVDLLKYDNCFLNDSILDPKPRYERMRDALLKVDRPIFFSMCEWGNDAPWYWGANVGNSWRIGSDINQVGFMTVIDQSVGLSRFAGPGGWNDPDFLQMGNAGMPSFEWYQLQFSLWCLIKAPLVLSFDMHRNMTSDILKLITNRELIAINQDLLGVQGDVISQVGPVQIWAGPLADGGRAFIIWERNFEGPQSINFEWVGYDNTTAATVRDILHGKDMGTHTGRFTASPKKLGDGNYWGFFVGRITPLKPNPKYLTWRPWHRNPYTELNALPLIN